MSTEPRIMNLGGFPLVIPVGKVIKFTRIGNPERYVDVEVPPVFGPSVVFLQSAPALDWDGHQYAIDVTYMEDECPTSS